MIKLDGVVDTPENVMTTRGPVVLFFEKKKRKEKYATVQSNRIFLLRWSFAVAPSPFGNLPFKTGGLQKRSERLGEFSYNSVFF